MDIERFCEASETTFFNVVRADSSSRMQRKNFIVSRSCNKLLWHRIGAMHRYSSIQMQLRFDKRTFIARKCTLQTAKRKSLPSLFFLRHHKFIISSNKIFRIKIDSHYTIQRHNKNYRIFTYTSRYDNDNFNLVTYKISNILTRLALYSIDNLIIY